MLIYLKYPVHLNVTCIYNTNVKLHDNLCHFKSTQKTLLIYNENMKFHKN